MHELSLCKRILEIVKEQLIIQKGRRIKIIYLELGELMAVEKAALLFSFCVIAKGSAAEDANLQIIDIPGEAWCENCCKLIRIKQYFFACETCGNFSLTIKRGNELRVKAMEVE